MSNNHSLFYDLEKIGINKYALKKKGEKTQKAVVYASLALLKNSQKDSSLNQLLTAAALPKTIYPLIGMPDIHKGFGLPIGGIMATQGLISVGAVGMDINCGVRLLTSQLKYNKHDFSLKKLKSLIKQIESLIPVGLGGRHQTKINLDLKKTVNQGVEYLVKQGFALKEDLEKIEEKGRMPGADFQALSQQARNRASKQLGTLGSGNHFIEVQKIEKIFDKNTAHKWGLFKDQICLMVHSGSRALGHQTCHDYTNIFWQAKNKYGLQIPNKSLAALPLETTEGQNYFKAMQACVNFAFSNRALISYFIRQIFLKRFNTQLKLLYDVAHNIAKWEEHKNGLILVHRKGATRALPANHAQNPKIYKKTGHPALVPGSMASPSYIMVGLPQNQETFYSINHGAGRLMSRTRAKKTISKKKFEKLMQNIVYNQPFHVVADEAPQAYKNITQVVNVLTEAGLTKKIAKLSPLAVIKGS